jgi:hypothetical protein
MPELTNSINTECVICGNEKPIYLYYNNSFCLDCIIKELEENGIDDRNEDLKLIKVCKTNYDRYKTLIDDSLNNIAAKYGLDIRPISELFNPIGGR